DMARVRGAPPYPGVAPVAMQMGRHAARLVRARLVGRSAGPFVYWDKGNLATIGRASAVCDLRGLELSGFVAWVTWLVIHLWYLVGFRNRVLVFVEWILSFLTHGREARLITGARASGWAAEAGALEADRKPAAGPESTAGGRLDPGRPPP